MKVLLVDDHPMIRGALQALVQALRPGAEVFNAATVREAHEVLRQHPEVDLTLLDLFLGDGDGFQVLDELRREHPAVPVVVVSASENAGDVIRALDMGAMGFVPKRSSNAEVSAALAKVLAGGISIPSDWGGPNRGAQVARPPEPDLNRWRLTPRQKEVLSCLLRGLPNKLIARELDLSLETVKDHVQAVLRALNVSTRTQVVVAVGQAGNTADQGLSWHRRAHV